MINQMAIGLINRSRKATELTVGFRCLPIDMDVYGHMNNANYFRVAELARWRQTAQSGLLVLSIKEGWMFLIAEQTVNYYKPILPFKPFSVRSSISTDDKWILYEHHFESPPCREGEVPTIHARIRLRAVVKQVNGKTVQPEEVLGRCPDIRAWLSKTSKAPKAE